MSARQWSFTPNPFDIIPTSNIPPNSSIFTRRLFTNGWLWGAVAICLALQGAAVYLPLLQKVLRTVAPTPMEWGVIAGCSLLPVVAVELVKLLTRLIVKPDFDRKDSL